MSIFSSYSNAEYCKKVGSAKAAAKHCTWLERGGLQAILELPTAKTASLPVLCTHITALFAILDPLLAHCSSWQVQAMQFNQCGLKQKVMEDICNHIVQGGVAEGDKRPVVVPFGAGMFSLCSRGHCPGPVKGVQKALH